MDALTPAQEKIIRNLAKRWKRRCNRFHSVEVDDYFQAGYCDALETLRKDGHPIPDSLVYMSASHAMQRLASREYRSHRRFAKALENPWELRRPVAPDPDASIDVGDSLRRLRDRSKWAITARYYRGLSREEMAAEIDVCDSTIGKIFRDAFRWLRDRLGPGYLETVKRFNRKYKIQHRSQDIRPRRKNREPEPCR